MASLCRVVQQTCGEIRIATGIFSSIHIRYIVLHIETQTAIKQACWRRGTGFPEFTGNFPHLFWNRTLHVSDRFSVHHQEFSTIYTAIDICHTEIFK
jgi:hypothetical protein